MLKTKNFRKYSTINFVTFLQKQKIFFIIIISYEKSEMNTVADQFIATIYTELGQLTTPNVAVVDPYLKSSAAEKQGNDLPKTYTTNYGKLKGLRVMSIGTTKMTERQELRRSQGLGLEKGVLQSLYSCMFL